MASGRKQPSLESVTTINADGSRYFLHPADVAGRWTRARRFCGLVLLAIYVLLPWIPVNGAPALFFDVEQRKFHVFGLTLVPQDLWVMFFGITGLGFLLFFVTSLMGRLWCGWTCPYTVFLDHLFRRVERWIEGDSQARRALDQAPWTAGKWAKRLSKHAVFLLFSALIAHAFLSYFVSLPRLYRFMHEGPLAHATAFGIVAFLTLVLWFCFGWFREQFCVILCPYGRLQSLLTDDDTINVGYDEKRGEPRGAKGKTEGDCLDCRRCVNVCPTGIDIRNGLQLECIGCAACIDACDAVMEKAGLPPGLVRYDSLTGLAGKPRRILRPRIVAYCGLALAGLVALTAMAWTQARPFTTTIARMKGAPFQADGTAVRNLFQLRILNKRNQPATFSITLQNAPPGFGLSGSHETFTAGPLGEITRPCVVIVPRGHYTGSVPLTFSILANPGNVTLTQTVTFLGPNPGAPAPTPPIP